MNSISTIITFLSKLTLRLTAFFDAFLVPHLAWVLGVMGVAAILQMVVAPLAWPGVRYQVKMAPFHEDLRRISQRRAGNRRHRSGRRPEVRAAITADIAETEAKIYRRAQINPYTAMIPILQIPILVIASRAVTDPTRLTGLMPTTVGAEQAFSRVIGGPAQGIALMLTAAVLISAGTLQWRSSAAPPPKRAATVGLTCLILGGFAINVPLTGLTLVLTAILLSVIRDRVLRSFLRPTVVVPSVRAAVER